MKVKELNEWIDSEIKKWIEKDKPLKEDKNKGKSKEELEIEALEILLKEKKKALNNSAQN